MRYEGTIQVIGFLDVVVDEPGISLSQAKAKVQADPQSYKAGYVEAIQFEAWEESLEKTEDDND